jgi:hypothetical protein
MKYQPQKRAVIQLSVVQTCPKFIWLMSNGKPKLYFMKYPHPKFFKPKYDNGAAGLSRVKVIVPEKSTGPEFYSIPYQFYCIVGIKFDNNWNGKPISSVFTAQGQKVAEKEMVAKDYYYWQLVTVENGPASNGMIADDGCNEPTVLCQSTFL